MLLGPGPPPASADGGCRAVERSPKTSARLGWMPSDRGPKATVSCTFACRPGAAVDNGEMPRTPRRVSGRHCSRSPRRPRYQALSSWMARRCGVHLGRGRLQSATAMVGRRGVHQVDAALAAFRQATELSDHRGRAGGSCHPLGVQALFAVRKMMVFIGSSLQKRDAPKASTPHTLLRAGGKRPYWWEQAQGLNSPEVEPLSSDRLRRRPCRGTPVCSC
jgi:hypothetical protein